MDSPPISGACTSTNLVWWAEATDVCSAHSASESDFGLVRPGGTECLHGNLMSEYKNESG
jgi:hypothetical protein